MQAGYMATPMSKPDLEARPAYRDRISPGGTPRGWAVLGDTQRTMLYQMLMGREWDNHPERCLLIESLAQRAPDALVLVGDLVCWGELQSDWRYFDQVMAPVRTRDIPVLPVVGNHDYFVRRRQSLPRLVERFARLGDETWYEERLGDLALLVLDSNRGPIGLARWEAQRAWLESRARALDVDPAVRGVIFFGHHPPITNSLEIGPHGPSLGDLVPVFARTKKAMLYVSGHCHAYERFKSQGKTFVVSGGGGGPRQILRRGRWTRHADEYAGGRLRPFHYLWLTTDAAGLSVTVHGLERRSPPVRELERFSIAWPTPA